MTITQQITEISDGPDKADQGTFNVKAKQLFADLKVMTQEFAVFIPQTNATAQQVNTDAGTATTAAAESAAAAQTATAAANAVAYSPATTYSAPDVAIGSDGHTYRCVGTDVVGVDPVVNTGSAWRCLTAYGLWLPRSGAYTASSREMVAVTMAAPWSLTLPLNPSDGDFIRVKRVSGSWETNTLTIARNGATIEGLAEDMTVASDAVTNFGLIFIAGTWRVFDE